MQIYELTSKNNSATTEAVNWGAVGKAIGSAATAAAGNYVNKTTGIDLAKDPANAYAGPAARDKAMAAVATMSKPQAAEQKKLFDKALSQLMAEKGVTNVAALTQSDTKGLSQNLYQQILKNLLQGNLTDYTDLPNLVAQGQPRQEATKIVQRITDAMTKIQDVPNYDPRNPAAQLAAWEALTQACGEAMVMLKFNRGGGVAGQTATPANINPAIQQMAKAAAAGKLTAQQLNIKPTVISSLQSKFPPGTDPKVDMLFQALGLYPTS